MKNVKSKFSRIGPAFLTTSSVFGPASVLMAAIAGAKFRYKCTWVLWFLLIDRIIFLDIGTRVGYTNKTTFGDEIRHRWGKPLAFIACITIAIPLMVYTASNALGTALAAQTIFNGNLLVWGLIFIAFACVITMSKRSYSILQKMAVFFMLLMFISFFITLCITGVHFGEFFRGMIPDFSDLEALKYALAIFLTNSSQQGVIHQYIIKQNNYSKDQITGQCRTDHIMSTVMVVLIIGMIMCVSAETLNVSGQVPTSAPGFVSMLEPLAGKAAKYIFGLGLFGAAITSLNGSSQVVGLGVSDAFGILKEGYADKHQKIITIVDIIVMGLYGILPVYFGAKNQLNIYMVASLMTAITIPVCGTCILKLFGDKEKMRDLSYSKGKYTLAWCIFIFTMCFCIYNFAANYIH